MEEVTVSYAITAWNEHEELDRLLSILHKHKRAVDEIVLQLDTTATQDVKEVALRYSGITIVKYPLEKNFAKFKNNLVKSCKCTIIVFIDADEYVTEEFIQYLPVIIESNPEVDVISIPRWNTVEGLTEEHINKWGWRVSKIVDSRLIVERELDTESEEYRLLLEGGFIIEEISL